MNRQQAKELLPIIQAFSEGKTIESRCIKGDTSLWSDDNNPDFDEDFEYRIKPEPKYRPFKDVKECWKEMLLHLPFGWVKYKDKDSYTSYWNVDGNCDFESDLNDYEFADGTPFGAIKDDLSKL